MLRHSFAPHANLRHQAGKLPGTSRHLLKLANGRNMAIQAAVNSDNLSGEECAFIGTQIQAHIGDILRAAITGNHDVIQEDIFQNLRNFCLIVGRNNETGAHAVAADIGFAVQIGRAHV